MIFENPYTLRIDEAMGIPRYFVSFADGQAVRREIEISRPVYKEFEKFERAERNMTRWNERHVERFEQTEEMLAAKIKNPPMSVEDSIIADERSELLRRAIGELPEIQRRRFVLYHQFGLTYEQIANMEGCTKCAVKASVDLAKGKVCEKMRNF